MISFCSSNFFQKILILFYFTTFSETFPQFKITEEATDQYSIDYFSNEIYYTELFEGYQRKVSLPDLTVTDSPFAGLPHFSKIYHQAVYFDQGKIILYDFVKDSSYLLYDLNRSAISFQLSKADDFNPTGLLFSPNDINLLINSSPTTYYSFLDSSLYSLETELPLNAIWSSDSTILLSFGTNIYEMNIYTLIIDIVIKNNATTSFDYESDSQTISYGVIFDSLQFVDQQMRLYDISKEKDSLIFSINDTFCAGSPVAITWIKWNMKNHKIAFLIDDGTAPVTGMAFYDLDSAKIFEITICNDYPLKQQLNWYNEDTLVYLNYDYDFLVFRLYGTSIKKITSVKDEVNKTNNFLLYGNYPNPFNPTTTLSYSIPNASKVNLTVYDILGNEIMVLVNEEKLAGRFEVDFNASYLPSGVYFYRLTTPTFTATKKMLIIR